MHSGLALSPDGRPYLMVHESCLNLIRTLPELPYSDTDIEDVDTDTEDHAYDSTSIGVMTLKPSFQQSSLFELSKPKSERFKQGWQQNANGEAVPGDILNTLASPVAPIPTNGEF